MFELSHMVWSEKYRPNTVEDCILPKATKKMVQGLLKSGQLPNLMLHGAAGTGKCLGGNELVTVEIDITQLSPEQILALEKYKIV